MKKRNLFICYFLLLILSAMFMACASPYLYEDRGYGISQPPPYAFEGPPDVVAMPDTDDVYFVPDIDVDMFFWNGWWWRPWEGRWYWSQYYDRGWTHYNNVPNFYYDVDPGWRRYYRDHNWYGHRWDYDRIPNSRLQHDWKSWHNNQYWERQKTWGVQGYQPRPRHQREEPRHQGQEQYQQRPEVQQPPTHEPGYQGQEQYQRKPEVQQPPTHEPGYQGQEQYQRKPEVQQPPTHEPGYQEQEQYQRKPEVQQPPAHEPRHQGQEQYQRKPEVQQPPREQETPAQHSQPRGHENDRERHNGENQDGGDVR